MNYLYYCCSESNTGKFLKRSGLSEHGQKAWIVTQEYSSKVLEFIEASSPEYYKATIETCKPYIKLAEDFYLVMKNVSLKIYDNAVVYVGKNGPVIIQAVGVKRLHISKILARNLNPFAHSADRTLCSGNVGRNPFAK